MVGAILILASVLRLGFVANFISEPVLVGFKAGIGVVIIVDQIPKILGIHFTKGSFLHNVTSIVLGLSHIVACNAGGGCSDDRRPRRHRKVQAALARAADRRSPPPSPPSHCSALQSHGIELVGAIPAGLPAFAVPEIGARAAAVARGPRHCTHELHGDQLRRARVREE